MCEQSISYLPCTEVLQKMNELQTTDSKKNETTKPKALVAMSGGVDSTVTCILMMANGFDTTGATIRMRGENLDFIGDRSCCSQKDIDDAKSICKNLGITHLLIDQTGNFETDVVSRFVDAYKFGNTPNPCVDCNLHIKFKTFFGDAKKLGFDKLATGHYARVHYDKSKNRYLLLKGKFDQKDQSYVLYTLKQDQLSRICFPCGEYDKEEIREIANKLNLINANKPDSQDICFIPNGDYHSFIQNYSENFNEDGEFIELKTGRSFGPHKGFTAYTIGQRKGLGISYNRPLFVIHKDKDTNTIYLGDPDDLMKKVLIANETNWILFDDLTSPIKVKAKIRYNHKEEACTVYPLENGEVKVIFDEPIRAITPGQSVVFYDGDFVVGGGKILCAMDS